MVGWFSPQIYAVAPIPPLYEVPSNTRRQPIVSRITQRSATTKISTITVHLSVLATSSELRSPLATTGPPAMPTYVHLRTISLGIPAGPATHNPLVHGSSPCGPTKLKAAHCAALVVSGVRKPTSKKPQKRYSVQDSSNFILGRSFPQAFSSRRFRS